ncbi:unnamed protein product [Linum tenue]|uniref:Uncharacterized protein n=1 Tax=Linum tenue TaxID=586396 RepID=A0AAV0IDV4_9ROSI|nr:unnamed protein product [Linum tenue]
MDSMSTLPLYSYSRTPPISPWSLNLSTALSPTPSTSPASTVSLTSPSAVSSFPSLIHFCSSSNHSLFSILHDRSLAS